MALRYQNIPQTPVSEVINDIQDIQDENTLATVLNSHAPLDADAARDEISQEQLLSIFRVFVS